jgi:heterodisulfide reductase subunit B
LLDVLLFFLPIPERTSSAVRNPLTSLKGVGYVGYQTGRPFAVTDTGSNYDTYDQPEFLEDGVKACGAEVVDYDPKTSCCSSSVSVYSPDKTLHLIKKMSRSDADADVIEPVTSVPTEHRNVPDAINKKFGTDFNIPVVFYSQPMPLLDECKPTPARHNMIKPRHSAVA